MPRTEDLWDGGGLYSYTFGLAAAGLRAAGEPARPASPFNPTAGRWTLRCMEPGCTSTCLHNQDVQWVCQSHRDRWWHCSQCSPTVWHPMSACGPQTPSGYNLCNIARAARPDNYGTCHHCGEVELACYLHPLLGTDEEHRYCAACRGNLLSYCRRCGTEVFTANCYNPNSSRSNRVCLSCHAAEEAALHTTFTVNKSARTVGVELEFITTTRPRTLNSLGSYHEDGSVRPDDPDECDDPDEEDRDTEDRYYGWEFATRPYRGDRLLETINTVCTTLRNARAYVNETCGVHVHLDLNSESQVAKSRLLRWWRIFEPLIFATVSTDRRLNGFCQPIGNKTFRHLNGDRYHALNVMAFEEHGTFEIRLHEGTLDQKTIIPWVRFLLAFFDTFTKVTVSDKDAKVRALAPREQLIFLMQTTQIPLSVRKHLVRRLRRYSRYSGYLS